MLYRIARIGLDPDESVPGRMNLFVALDPDESAPSAFSGPRHRRPIENIRANDNARPTADSIVEEYLGSPPVPPDAA